MADKIKKILREPLLHFLLLGMAIFIAYGMFSMPSGNEPGKIIITQGELKSMREAYFKTWKRPPTQNEFEGLIRDRVREEVYYREALALGMDKDDIIIRRRLRQKMEFIANDIVKQAEPTDEDLSEFLAKHPELFNVETCYNFRQIYLNPDRHGKSLKQDITRLLSELNQPGSNADFQKMGDASLLPPEMTGATEITMTSQFGEEFKKQLIQSATGRWVGPVSSVYGIHLVRIDKHTEGGVPALPEIRDAVQREWESVRRMEANEKFYGELLKNYTVTIEKPEIVKDEKLSSIVIK
jgi:hypothetical protein